MTIIHSTIEPRKHVRVTPIGDQDVALDIGRPGRPVVRLAGIRIPVAKLRAALDADAPAGPDTRTDEEDWEARAEKLEKERDEAIRRMNDHSTNARGWMQTSEEWQATAEEWEKRALKAKQERDEARVERDSWRAQVPLAEWEKELIRATDQPRALAADDITDEMVQRGAQATTPAGVRYLRPHEVREVLTAALTEPTRPEGAENWEDWLIHNLDHESLTDQQIEDLANRIAQRVTEEQS